MHSWQRTTNNEQNYKQMKTRSSLSSGIALLLMLLLPGKGEAQELNCQVNVVASQIQPADPDKFVELRREINEFMNHRQWTNVNVSGEERIDCSILINVTREISSDKYQASIQVQSRRPIYNTSYHSPILNYQDNNLTFEYAKYDNLNFDVNTFHSNLTSVLAFYAYLIIGLDFDSFSPMGGTPYFQNAQTIVVNAQNTDYQGWKSFESRQNRYWIIEDLLSGSLSSMRQGNYNYHRLGLDRLADEMESGRQQIMDALEKFRQAKRQKSFLHILDVLLNAKRDELINIFREAPASVKANAVNLLKELDPANSSDYDGIMEG